MASSLSLDGIWKVRGFDGQHGELEPFAGDGVDERTFFDAHVPGEIHLDLEREGWLEDCRCGLNALSARWVEEQEWFYRTRFQPPAEALKAARAWLVFDALDLTSGIYVNGEQVGRHANTFRPCRIDVTGKLREGENLLAVAIESGLYSVAEKPGAAYCAMPDHRLHKRSWLRKPQNSFSWDWCPRLVNVGIWKSVRLEWAEAARIDAVTVYPVLSGDHSTAELHTNVFIENVAGEERSAIVRMTVEGEGLTSETEVTLPAGMSRQEVSVTVTNPRLWWPRTHGDQPLYDVRIELVVDGSVCDSAERRTGIRSISINQEPHPEEGRYFIVEVNGQPVFWKGANWVPADMIYARTGPEHYRKLAELAAEANFNSLRIWGGGLYADHALLAACDELGILVWHDFIFACSKYPADDPEFLAEVRQETAFNVRDLSHHPSLAVWCGNNELEWGVWDWGYDRVKAYPDYALFHHEIPTIINREDPSRPYWPSSPHSLDHQHPNSPITGDQHPWDVSLGPMGPDFWDYRKNVSRFPNEGGVMGATSIATLKEFLPESERRIFSTVWEYHDNGCNYRMPRGVTYQAFEMWLGAKPEDVSFEDYVYYSGVVQSEGLQEYINNFRRRMFSTSSAIFWMYNDCWPASHGWTIVDYYLRRKLAYHPVRRAFSDITIIASPDGDNVVIMGVNDSLEKWEGKARFGACLLKGGFALDREVEVVLQPNSATRIAEFPQGEIHSRGAEKCVAFALLSRDGAAVAQNRLFLAPYKDLEWAQPDVKVERQGAKAIFSSDVFVWGVCLDPDGDQPLADDLFDLLPGIPYGIDWAEDRPLPEIRRITSPGLARR